MGFFDRLRKGQLFYGKVKSDKWKMELPDMVVQFLFAGKKYILESFDLSFCQDVTDRNKPDSETYGGRIVITFGEPPGEEIGRWMLNTHRKKDGEFRFFNSVAKKMEGAVLHVCFKDAVCVGYHKKTDTMGAGVLTTLTIFPDYLKIGNEEWERI